MRNVLVAVGVCLLSVMNAAAQWTPGSTSDPTTRTGSVGIGTAVTTPAAPLDISTGTTQAWINLSSSNALPPKINFMQSAAAAVDLGIGSVNFTNGVGTVVGQISARYPGTDQTQSYMRFSTSGLERLRIDSSGNVGIGTDTPVANSTQTGLEVKSSTTAALWMTGTSGQGAAIRGRNMNASGTASAMDDIFLAMGGLGYDGSAFASANRASIHFAASQAWTPANQGTYMTFNTTPNNSTVRAERMRIDNAGNVGIGILPTTFKLEVAGDAYFSGTVTGRNIQANYQDVAEWVPAVEAMAAGTVVVVDEGANNTVTPSMHAYDTSVAGVVSPNPGLLLGVAGASKAKIATTGRVHVRVDATKSPIRKGDLLVTSDRPGMAMKSEPLDIGGVKLHRPGTLIGKALEPLAGGVGEILVLLSLQ